MAKIKKVPMRKCIGCGTNKPKKDLIRIVKNKEGEIFLDKTGKKNGRGAYICFNEECLEKAIKSKALNRAFEMEIRDETYNELINSLKQD
ncbi:RNase P modulator RnpM [Anaerosphaera multitolerans]|uniref:YlxR family protein n=1 Tax=Anaerosphaera multitolerans TaxID=2487351 RepID=A0A437S571_9FIRM|nr:YlxR family protein [Anaerosphaera multitolerans]RVU54175.1 YlxR family protein [Anaerosphaera multitolerans]